MSTTSGLEATAPKVSLEQEDGLCFHHNIPRGMVHRAAISEVFLTDSHRTPTGVAVAAQLPRNHAYFSDHRGTATNYDSLLLVEVFRQVAIYYAHEYRDVSTDRKFVFSAAEYGILEPASLRIGSAPGHCVVMAEPVDEKTRGDELVGLTLQMTAFVDGVEAARETMRYHWMPKEAWAKVRSRTRIALGLPETHALPAPSLRARLRPEAVGRTNPRNSILAEPAYDERGRFVALALVDTDHPSLFDHALDHVPGMLQFEALRQAAMAGTGAKYGLDTGRLLMTHFDVAFTRFGEFELDTVAVVQDVVVINEHHYQASVALMQDDVCISKGEVGLRVSAFDARNMLR